MIWYVHLRKPSGDFFLFSFAYSAAKRPAERRAGSQASLLEMVMAADCEASSSAAGSTVTMEYISAKPISELLKQFSSVTSLILGSPGSANSMSTH